jgi:RNA polymerase sigma factor (sigma-70 family)
MSSAVPLESGFVQPDPQRVIFWIRPMDDDGFQADRAFVEAAYVKANELRLYRWRDLRDDAVRADLVNDAVYAASRAQKGTAVRDAKGYLFTVFTRLADAYIAKEKALTQAPSSELERLEKRAAHRTTAEMAKLDRAILRSQVLNVMPPAERQAWERRLTGYEVQEIAADLNISPDCLSTRMRRAAREAARILCLGAARQ